MGGGVECIEGNGGSREGWLSAGEGGMDGLRKKRVEGDDILKVVILANISFRHVLILTNLHLDIHTHNNQQYFLVQE